MQDTINQVKIQIIPSLIQPGNVETLPLAPLLHPSGNFNLKDVK